MDYISSNEASENWGISLCRVQDLCKDGKIKGAIQLDREWKIPCDAPKPMDERINDAEDTLSRSRQILLRKSPFLDMTDLYDKPGTADACTEKLSNHPESKALFAAEIAYSRGEIDKVYNQALTLLQNTDNFYAVISGGMLLSLVAMWKGDDKLWYKAKRHLYDAPCKTELDMDIVKLSVAASELSIRNTKDFPDWFYRGRFENLPPDAHPAAHVFYIKYLIVFAQELATGKYKLDDVHGLGLMRSLPFIMEPMIAQAVVDKTIMVEIYLRLLCAISYHQIGDTKSACLHLDKAISLCLADKLYGPLVEHRRQLGLFLDERLGLANKEALHKVKQLHKKLYAGWTRLHNIVMERNISDKLSDREREIVRLVAFGLSDAQIADQLHLTKSSVKSMLQMARSKTGIQSRKDFAIYI